MDTSFIPPLWRRTLSVFLWQAGVALGALLSASDVCYPADLVFVQGRDEHAVGHWQLDVAARLYGVRLRRLTIEQSGTGEVLRALRRPDTLAAILSAGALRFVSVKETLPALERGGGRAPLLIVDVEPGTDTQLLRQWSEGAVIGCAGPFEVPSLGFYTVSDFKPVTRQLAGHRLPFQRERFCRLRLDQSRRPQDILGVHSNDEVMPVLVRTLVGEQEIFFQAALEGLTAPPPAKSWPITEVFPAIAPLAMFIRYAAGEYAWHPPGHYANLTMDDPWLTEPYGHLSYRGLLEQMKTHNFHTTIAFIPWNYDRSDPDVAALFRAHPERFSLSIHGNNHDHDEFPLYDRRPLETQVMNLRQALARMERFHALTQLPYDRVMIFPHQISPAATLGALKKYNYMATMNSTNVPIDSAPPADPLFPLRAASLSFENFTSVRRYSVEGLIHEHDVAIEAFLENPLLFYGHHSVFATGIDAFDRLADTVNRIQPDTQWRNLGYIARHLYLQRQVGPGRHEVFAYSSALTLENPAAREVAFLVRRDEEDRLPIRSVTVNGQPHGYQRPGNLLTLELTVPPGSSRDVLIEYENDLDLGAIDIAKSSLRVRTLRYISDFRDLMLSKFPLGQKVIEVYYRDRRPSQQLGRSR